MPWSLDPLVLAGLATLGVLYAIGVARSRVPSGTWLVTAFYGGLAVIFVALVSPLAALTQELFLAHMVQHLLLVMAGIPLVLIGAPARPLLRGLPASVRASAVRPLARSGAVRAVGHLAANPLVALGAYVGLLSLWHLPPLYDAALESQPLHVLEHLTFLIIAVLFWSQVIDPLPWRAPLALPLRIVYLFVATAHNTVLGGILSFAEPTLYAHYAQRLDRLFGLSAAVDQQWGGVIMWVPGGMVHLVAISFVFAYWLSAEDRAGLESPRFPDPALR